MPIANLTTGFRGRLIISAYRNWLPEGSSVLDVGCGSGLISVILQRHLHLKVTGCDIRKYLTVPLKFVLLTRPDKLPFHHHQFDVVMFNDVLHHVDYNHQQEIIAQALRVGKSVLLFEFQPTTLGKLADQIINFIHYRQQHFLFSYRQVSEWEKLFKKSGASWEKQIVAGPWWYPFQHLAYRLYKAA